MIHPGSLLTTMLRALAPSLGRRLLEWSKGSEARRLVRLLRDDFPDATNLLYQPDVLRELYLFAETGNLDADATRAAVRPVAGSDEEAARMVEAIRTRQWRAVRDERRSHFEMMQLRDDLTREIGESSELIRVDNALAAVRDALPAARQLPAQTSPFFDRVTELAAGEKLLADRPSARGALVIGCCGMPGIGKSAYALELAYRRADTFSGGWLYADLRTADGVARDPGDVAARLLVELGVSSSGIPSESDARLAVLRSVMAEKPFLLLLDNARDVNQRRQLIPANQDSVVIVTSQVSLADLGATL